MELMSILYCNIIMCTNGSTLTAGLCALVAPVVATGAAVAPPVRPNALPALAAELIRAAS